MIIANFAYYCGYRRKFPKLHADGGIHLPFPRRKMFSPGVGVLADSSAMVK